MAEEGEKARGPLRVVVTCGGTGGHAFPGLAVADELRRRGHEVEVWNTGRAIESAVMREWTGPSFATGAKPLSPRFALANLLAFNRCRRRLKAFAPQALLAMGSYSSLPPVLAARLRGVPVVLHEANTVPGRAVDVLSRGAKGVAISFERTAQYLPGRPLAVTGLPVRARIASGTRFADVPAGAFVVFVTGGSQGAHRVNELASHALELLRNKAAADAALPPLYVIHQTGAADEGEVLKRYAAAGIPARVQAFEREMPNAFATADFVIARAGASTCFELALCGKPALLVPLPSALRNHQHFNADAFAAQGAADEGNQETLSPRALADYLLNKMRNRASLAAMAEKMKALATPDAAARVADLVERCAE